jgi:hypothetical protein
MIIGSGELGDGNGALVTSHMHDYSCTILLAMALGKSCVPINQVKVNVLSGRNGLSMVWSYCTICGNNARIRVRDRSGYMPAYWVHPPQ